MERVSMFVPTYQGLAATDFFKPSGGFRGMFPFTAPGNLRFYRARNAIYYLFKELRASSPQLTVLAPDYHSGNEVLALRAAGAAVHYYPIHRDMRHVGGDKKVVARVSDVAMFQLVAGPQLHFVATQYIECGLVTRMQVRPGPLAGRQGHQPEEDHIRVGRLLAYSWRVHRSLLAFIGRSAANYTSDFEPSNVLHVFVLCVKFAICMTPAA